MSNKVKINKKKTKKKPSASQLMRNEKKEIDSQVAELRSELDKGIVMVEVFLAGIMQTIKNFEGVDIPEDQVKGIKAASDDGLMVLNQLRDMKEELLEKAKAINDQSDLLDMMGIVDKITNIMPALAKFETNPGEDN